MLKRFAGLAIGLAVFAPPAVLSQSLSTGIGSTPGLINGLGNSGNPTPGGLTLVPGTVVVPGASGAQTTGIIPLPGTSGPTDPSAGLYPPAYYSQGPSSGTAQITLPQNALGPTSPPVIMSPEPAAPVVDCADLRYARLCRR